VISKWAGNVAKMEETRNTCKNLIRKPCGNINLNTEKKMKLEHIMELI
jgi:hypothetical protein